MRWYVDREGDVDIKPYHVAFKSRPDAERLALELTAIHNRIQIDLSKAKTEAARERVLIDGRVRVQVAMEDAELAQDAPAAEAYADSLGKE